MTFRVLGSAGLLLMVACGGGSPPPPRPAEVPMDETTPTSQAESHSDSQPASGSGDSASSGSGGSSSAASASTADPSASTPAKSGLPPASSAKPATKGTGALLSAKECSDLMDKGFELMAFGDGGPLRGTSGKQKDQQFAMLKQVATNDPNYAKELGECAKNRRRSHYDCGMRARNVTEWADCIR